MAKRKPDQKPGLICLQHGGPGKDSANSNAVILFAQPSDTQNITPWLQADSPSKSEGTASAPGASWKGVGGGFSATDLFLQHLREAIW